MKKRLKNNGNMVDEIDSMISLHIKKIELKKRSIVWFAGVDAEHSTFRFFNSSQKEIIECSLAVYVVEINFTERNTSFKRIDVSYLTNPSGSYPYFASRTAYLTGRLYEDILSAVVNNRFVFDPRKYRGKIRCLPS